MWGIRINMELKKILNYLAYTNIIISLGPISLVYLTVSLLELPSNPIMYFICILVAFFVYSINRFTDIKEDVINNSERTEVVRRGYYLFLFCSAVSLIFALFLSFFHSFSTFLIIILPILFVFLYSVKWLPKKGFAKKRLKEFFLVKNIIVSIGWAIIPLYVSVYTNIFLSGMIFISIFIFLRIFIGVIMFDIRDVVGDGLHNIQTIPSKISVGGSKKIILVLNFLSVFILFAGIIFNLLPIYAAPVGLFVLLMGFFYLYLFNRGFDIKFICNVIVDGEYILIGVLCFTIMTIISFIL